jgi:hypothetical protein
MQGLHQSAKKLTTTGLPSVPISAVSTLLPFISLRVTEGNAADALNAANATAPEKRILFNIIYSVFIFIFVSCFRPIIHPLGLMHNRALYDNQT